IECYLMKYTDRKINTSNKISFRIVNKNDVATQLLLVKQQHISPRSTPNSGAKSKWAFVKKKGHPNIIRQQFQHYISQRKSSRCCVLSMAFEAGLHQQHSRKKVYEFLDQ
ncbi:MAG: hypothetical protein ABI123_09455, partial [Ginsengibacter sp.]